MLTVCTVLRSGGEYMPRHVELLREQVQKHLPGCTFVALSDQHLKTTTRVPLKYPQWAGWFAKMELFSPDLRGDILYFDLDTVIVDSLEDIASVGKLTVLRDFYRDGVRKPEQGIGSGVMYIPEDARPEVWNAWTKGNTFQIISDLRHRGVGDQDFLGKLWYDKAARWQDEVPGQICSYKVDCNPKWSAGAVGKVPPGARAVCGHGRPRPWSSQWKLA